MSLKLKFDIGTCVFYKDRIYKIFSIMNKNGKFVYSIDNQCDMYINVENEDELTLTKNDKKKFKIGDKVKYYDQKDDLIHEGIIKKWFENMYVYFEDGNGTYIDYLGIEDKKLRKFDVGQSVNVNNQIKEIIKFLIIDSDFYYYFNDGTFEKESMLSPMM